MTAFPTEWQLHHAARTIRAGGVLAYPTEAVFGLGCAPGDGAAVTRLLQLKNRPPEKGLILIASSWEQLAVWLRDVPPAAKKRLQSSWPGPVTWLIPAAENCPRWLTGNHSTLAVRITAHPLVRRLCELLNSAIVSTSANRAGKAPARSVLQLHLQFGNQLDYILPGPLGNRAQPSEIRDLASGRIVRESAP